MPHPNNLPKTKYNFDKILQNYTSMKKRLKHRFCAICSAYIGKWEETENETCGLCGNGEEFEYSLEHDMSSYIQNAFEKRNLHSYIDKQREKAALNDDSYIYDMNSGSKLKHIYRYVLQNPYDICLMWNVDGIPVANSSKGQLWPIQAQIVNVPPENRRNF